MEKIKLISPSYLTEDMWFQIFVHLPLNAISKFKCVSKVWLSILSNPSFIPWTLVHYDDLLYDDLLLEDRSQHNSKLRKRFTFACPDMHSQFLSYHQYGLSFSFLNQILVNSSDLYIVGSSNGLVLCTTSLTHAVTYCVCNPLANNWVLLPPPPTTKSWVLTGFVCEDESSPVSFTVIRMLQNEHPVKYKVEVFSSDSGVWNIYDVPSCPLDYTWKLAYEHKLVVAHNGVCYWLQKPRNNILAFSVNRHNKDGTCGDELRLINFPGRVMDDEHQYISQCLGESEGCVCYAEVKEEEKEKEKSLVVWVLEEDWYLLYKDIKFHEIESLLIRRADGGADSTERIQVLGFNPVDKNVVILSYKKYIWAYNTKTRGYKQIRHHLSYPGRHNHIYHMRFLTFALKLRPTTLPPVTW